MCIYNSSIICQPTPEPLSYITTFKYELPVPVASSEISKSITLKPDDGMDDLSGLRWTGNAGTQKPPPMISNPHFPNARATPPISGRSTPLSGSAMRSVSPDKPSTPANDSFANLVNFRTGPSGKNVSLAERQRQLAEQRALEEKRKRAQLDAQYGGNNDQFWDSLEKSGMPASTSVGLTTSRNAHSAHTTSTSDMLRNGSGVDDDEEDILAAFNASAPVDKSTNFPVPSSTASPVSNAGLQVPAGNNLVLDDDDDDPFGLGEMRKRTQPSTTLQGHTDEDDDILGPLAKPVSEFTKPTVEVRDRDLKSKAYAAEDPAGSPDRVSPIDRAIAELVDMGFPIEKASEALSTTQSGTDVQAAVSWLLNQAHAEAQEKARGRSQSAQAQSRSERPSPSDAHRERVAWQPRDSSLPTRVRGQDRFEGRSQTRKAAEKDATQLAADFGNNLFKSANSLWKSGTKRVQQAVQEFNSTPDPSQPRWMREAQSERMDFRMKAAAVRRQPRQQDSAPRATMTVTDEAMMLEMGKTPPSKSPRPSRNQQSLAQDAFSPNATQDFSQSQPLPRRPRQPQQVTRSPPIEDSRSRLSRLAADEQASQAYVSPARRRRKPSPQAPSEPEPDLLEGSSRPSQLDRSASQPSAAQQPRASHPVKRPPTALPPKLKAPLRQIPPVSASTLLSSHKHRQDGSAAFKRGDFTAAHASYSAAISLLPGDHPITIILLVNRALTALKIGEPKTAINDADRALSIIGPSKGESEKIDLGNGEPEKEMRDFFGKAMMRKAEALEQLEKWIEAAKIWRETVESGHGGSAGIQGRTRCEKAAGIGPPSSSTRPITTSSRSLSGNKPTQPSRPGIRAQPSILAKPAEAVNRLRAANEAADRLDNEKFALADAVDARLTVWKGGKQDNLRALLASLDTVLWTEAGWKKLSMAELVLPNKVKIHYMKGIAKVHPDKIPVNATTEQRMIAGAVFSTLNEAWDKFKQENGL
ncbi:auxilin-like clathrin-binding protein required for normal clathrin function [Emydomyces testavorans]|uniref:Auxilin-like clathrin-binding protein required for normal clathrin function n=1 Tax=Emydomyces testavorans TaxID=2070801 RepID=A0AAF0DEJ6_9EURO|nr:auxilin-like clathrin-binding protein required for normal clathrin function [Emydomyces testavorans]